MKLTLRHYNCANNCGPFVILVPQHTTLTIKCNTIKLFVATVFIYLLELFIVVIERACDTTINKEKK